MGEDGGSPLDEARNDLRDERRLRAIARLVERDGNAEWELDLRGLDLAHARASVERMVERNRFGSGKTVLVRLDPATPTSGETLFLPIGRLLLGLMKRHLVRRCNPLAADQGAGFRVELAGRPAREPQEAT
jgi:hypothetical protein